MKETLKIRHYVVGVIYHAGERSVQIMSSRNLAKQFGMARSTVSIALKELIDQGYLIPVRGKGNFTNPRKIMTPLPEKMPPLILLVHSDGRSFYYGSQEWESISTIGKAVTDAGCFFRQLTLTSTDEEDLYREIMGAQADGLIWIDSLPAKESLLRRLSESGLPVVSDSISVSSVNTVVFDTRSACRKIGERLARERKTNLLYCLGEWYRENDLPPIREAFAEAGIPLQVTFCDSSEGPLEREVLSRYLLEKRWDAVFSQPQHIPLLEHTIAQLGIEPPELLARLRMKHAGEEKLEFRFPFYERAEKTVKRMMELLNGDQSVRRIQIPMKLVRYQ